MAKSRFDICLDLVLQQEGGYADHPSDPGGATNLGITRKTLARWRQVSPWWSLSKTDVQGLQRPEAARIFARATGSRFGLINCRPDWTWRCSTLPSIRGRIGPSARCRVRWACASMAPSGR
ncbi:MAG: glycosyl hydrolase 108 family protein [Devosia sp.]|nr:glycosyl hydrolase 108 family protein [Devosia sp.]MDP2782892.1 glycosyl hydrolase 108 family protein [Devosia sp.]